MILMYHNISDKKEFNTISKQSFVDQIEYLKEHNYNVVPFDVYVNLILEKRLTRNVITISFDDAYKSFSDYAIPVLEKYDYSAILFIPVNFVSQYNIWDSHLTNLRIPILSWAELKIISKNKLIRIGSHGLNHRALSSLANKDMYYEISESKKIIEENLNLQVDYFSYPYGQYKHFNSTAVEALKENNYKAACSTNWGGGKYF